MIIHRTPPQNNNITKDSLSNRRSDHINDDLYAMKEQNSVNLLIFCAEWSGTSHMLIESLKENTKRLAQVIDKVVVIDFDNDKELVEKFNIDVIPTSIITNNDKELHKFVGLFSFDEMKKVIEKNNF